MELTSSRVGNGSVVGEGKASPEDALVINEDRLKASRILVVDDEETNVRLMGRILERAGFANHRGLSDPREVVGVFLEFQPDLIVLDLRMPHMDGFMVMEALAPLMTEDAFLPVLVLTAELSPEAKRRALNAGANDFLSKPFDTVEVILRIRNLLEIRYLHLRLHENNEILEKRVVERTRELEAAKYEILERLALAAEFRDDATGEHTRRVGRIAGAIARQMKMSDERVHIISLAAPLHDIGKIGIPDHILLKRDSLSPEEFELMKAHTLIGSRILSGSDFPIMRMAEEIALTHHERWDGSGYPHGTVGDNIPLSGRIVAVADIFDALTHTRPYKDSWTWKHAVAEVDKLGGKHLDPAVVDAFRRLEESGDLYELFAGDAPLIGGTLQGGGQGV